MNQARGQDFLWKGRIIDQASKLPIEGAHIKSENRQGITDREGYFNIGLKLGDSITISHVSYQAMEFLVKDKVLPPVVSLNLLEQELGEVTVTSLPSEARLKQLLLESPYIPSSLEDQLQHNLSYMKTIHRLNNNHILNALDFTHRKLNRGNGEATFLSTNPSLGIMGVIRSFRKPGSIPFDKSIQYRQSPTFKFRSDTTSRYSDYFDKEE